MTEIDYSTSITDALYVGWTGKLDASLVSEPALTKTEMKKDPASQAEILSQKREERLQTAGVCPFAFGLTELVVLRGEANVPVFSAKKNAALRFVQWLSKEYPGYFGRWLSSTPTNETGTTTRKGVAFLGFDMKAVLRSACMEVLAHNLHTDIITDVPVRLWHSPSNVYDTEEFIGKAEQRKLLDMFQVARRLAIPEELCSNEALQAPLAAAQFTRALAARMQLFGV